MGCVRCVFAVYGYPKMREKKPGRGFDPLSRRKGGAVGSESGAWIETFCPAGVALAVLGPVFLVYGTLFEGRRIGRVWRRLDHA